MAYWVGVVSSREGFERLRNEDDTWWCLSKTAATGDLLAIYVARTRLKDVPEDQLGITAIFEITGPAPERAVECKAFGHTSFGSGALLPVRIKMKERFFVSIRLPELRLDAVLGGASFVRRNFQGTVFRSSKAQFAQMRKIVSHKRDLRSSTSRITT